MASTWRLRPFQFGLLVLIGACQPSDSEDGTQLPQTTVSIARAEESDSRLATCSYPVERGDTMASLRKRFGERVARPETLGGAEGIESAGLTLWPDDPTRRIEVFFGGEDANGPVSYVRLGTAAQWRVAGLGIGDPLAKVREANGTQFTFWGFGWDYGGYVSELSDGQLTKLSGGCSLTLRFDVAGAAPQEFYSEVDLSSDDPRVRAIDVRLVEIGIGFREE